MKIRILFYFLCIILLFLNLSGCAANKPSANTATIPIDYLRGHKSVVLRAQVNHANLTIQAVLLSSISEFCLYGDGTVIYKSDPEDIYPVRILRKAMRKISPPYRTEEILSPQLKTARLSEEEIQELLKFVIEENNIMSLITDKEHGNNGPSVTIEINTKRGFRSVKLYSDGPKELMNIYNRLLMFKVYNPQDYRPSKISISVYRVPDFMDNATKKATVWNFKEVSLLELSKEYGSRDVGGKGIGKLLDFFKRYPPDLFYYFEGYKVFGIFYRPYLPHEIDER